MPKKYHRTNAISHSLDAVTQIPLTLGVRQAAEASGLSQRYLREKLMTGELRSVRVGRRVLIPAEALKEFLGV